jgi:DNA repair exonuclease SbcCD ATPase subunit
MSNLIDNNEDKLEELESLIGLIEDLVLELKKLNSVSDEKLNEFMSEYIDLEDKILTIMQQLSEVLDIKNKMINLTKKFNTYWGEYQNTWPDNFWDTYDMYRSIIDKDMPHNNFNIKPVVGENDLFYENDFEKCQALQTDENQIEFSNKLGQNLQKIKSASTHDESMNASYLGRIDEEMKEVQEITIVKDKKDEKRRGCLECIVM